MSKKQSTYTEEFFRDAIAFRQLADTAKISWANYHLIVVTIMMSIFFADG